MHLFYTPDIKPPLYTLSEEESKHCVRVLRLSEGDRLMLTDGHGTMYTAEVVDANPKRCAVRVVETAEGYGRRGWSLTMAVAPTKNIERYEWFLEKATEVGCDVFIPIECEHSERRTVKPEREIKVVTSAVKQSFKAYHPALEAMTGVDELIARRFDGVKLIAHCGEPIVGRKYISQCVRHGDAVLALIGPEGDFSPGEVQRAVDAGFVEISLGDARLRTETAALDAVIEIALINRHVDN
jgi:16S rRNA (uracil1498-N3)-methyltransferase